MVRKIFCISLVFSRELISAVATMYWGCGICAFSRHLNALRKKSFLLYVLLKVRSARGGMGGGEGPPYSCGSVGHTIGSLVDMPQHLGCEPWPITRQGRGSRCRAPLPPRGRQGTRYSELCFSTSRIQEMK